MRVYCVLVIVATVLCTVYFVEFSRHVMRI